MASSKILAALAGAVMAASAFVTTAEAGCGGGYGGGTRSYSSHQSYSGPSYAERRYALAKARAQAKAKAAARSKVVAAARAKADERARAVAAAKQRARIAKLNAAETADTAAATVKEPVTVVAAKVDESSVPATGDQAAKEPAPQEAQGTQGCRKFSAVTGGLIEVECK